MSYFLSRHLSRRFGLPLCAALLLAGLSAARPARAVLVGVHNITVATDPGVCTALVSSYGVSSSIAGATVVCNPNPPHTFPVGTTAVTCDEFVGGTNTDHATFTVTVLDKEPPVISNVSANPNTLWPPNHKMVLVTVSYTVTDNCTPPLPAPTSSLSVASNEAINGKGDGNTSPDWQVVDAHHVYLRAERAGPGSGRVYTITITATDASGNTSTAIVNVTVPHDQGKGK